MSDLSEIKRPHRGAERRFEQFKKTNDAKIEAVKAAGATGDFEAKLKAIADDMAKRPRCPEGRDGRHRSQGPAPEAGRRRQAAGRPGAEEHKKAFNGYVRKGAEFDKLHRAEGPEHRLRHGRRLRGPQGDRLEIEALAVNISPIRSLATVQQISTSDFHKLVNVRGTTSGWVGETQTRTGTNNAQLVDIAPPMGELYAMPAATQQMLDDVFFDAEKLAGG
jgi:HK97 family phage major capsid protein